MKIISKLIKKIRNYLFGNRKTVSRTNAVRSISSDRVFIRYAEDGGIDKDGLIELRRDAGDLSLGNSKYYAQVRIGVDGSHYMKGMAVYSDDVHKGYDVVYNTNKKKGTDKYKVFKEMEHIPGSDAIDESNPFGVTVKASDTSVVYIVTEQADWHEWSESFTSQLLYAVSKPRILTTNQFDSNTEEQYGLD